MTLPWGSSRFDQAAAHVVSGGGGGGGAFAYIVSASAGSVDSASTSTIAVPINTTGADLLIVGVSDYDGGSGTLTDVLDGFGTPSANTWTPLTAANNTGVVRARIYYSKPTHVGTGHVVSFNGSGNYASLVFAAFSGSHATPFDVEAQGTGTSSTASAGSGITPSQNNELVIATVGVDTVAVSSINLGFTILATNAYSGGVHQGGSLAYKIQTSAAATDPDWALSGSGGWAAAIASFKAV